MKHAYLILAHNEFEVLQLLLQAIDNANTDIYIHVDKKTVDLPPLATIYSKLFILQERVDVRWGDVSMIEAEMALFENAFKNGPYHYYHLLSGVDMPLKPQNEIQDFFNQNAGKEFIGFNKDMGIDEINKRVKKIHLYPKNFRDTKGFLNFYRRSMRYMFIWFQYVTGMSRNKKIHFKKGTQWVSVTHSFVEYLISLKKEIFTIYQNSFCSDELFVQTACWNSPFRNKIYDMNDEGRGCQRKIGWRNGELVVFEKNDFDEIIQSDMMFARKFSGKNIDIVKMILWRVNR